MGLQKIGRYEILSELGRGAMGVVYKAVDPVLDRIVAIKTINLSLDPDGRDEYEARFQQEAKAAGSLSHPAIVTIHDLGNTDDLVFMAMEFLDGQELRDMIGNAHLPIKQAISIAAQVASGLGYAHQRGIVHRDIKPANIMVLNDGVAKITDFGIARMRVSDVRTQTGTRLGSPKYMSPEQVIGLRLDHRTDIFSLGVVLYEMLTGKAPFGGNSLEALMYQTVNVAPPPPSRLNPDVPEMLDLILAKALEKRAENRYQHAEDMASDLRECEKHYGSALPADNRAAKGLHELPPHLSSAVDETPQSLADSRQDKTAGDGADTNSIGLSSIIDSFSATQRLAREVGMSNEFDEYSATIRLVRSDSSPAPAPATARHTLPHFAVPRSAANPATKADGNNSARTGGALTRNRRDKLIAFAILIAALVSAGLIIFG